MNNDLLLQLINDIIDMAKIESGSLDFTYDQVDINELMEDICHQIKLKTHRMPSLYLSTKSYPNV